MNTKTHQIFELSAPYNNSCQGKQIRALFVCSAGLLRSPTAATIGSQGGLNTRSCGTEEYALIPLSANLIHWADIIYFVNDYNYESARRTFRGVPELHEMILDKAEVWNILDEYDYMQPELVEIISRLLSNY